MPKFSSEVPERPLPVKTSSETEMETRGDVAETEEWGEVEY